MAMPFSSSCQVKQQQEPLLLCIPVLFIDWHIETTVQSWSGELLCPCKSKIHTSQCLCFIQMLRLCPHAKKWDALFQVIQVHIRLSVQGLLFWDLLMTVSISFHCRKMKPIIWDMSRAILWWQGLDSVIQSMLSSCPYAHPLNHRQSSTVSVLANAAASL